MKTKNKLILSAAAMLTISAAAMVTGTVAWFTTVRQSTITINNVTVVSTIGNLKVSYIGDGTAAEPGENGDFTVTGATFTSTDLSGDGLDLYKPKWIQEGVSAFSIDNVKTTGVAAGHFAEFQLKIERDNPTAGGFLVYLGSPSELIPDDDDEPADVAAANSARVAFLDAAKTTRIFTWAPEAGDASYKYINAGGAGLYTIANFQESTYATPTFFSGPIVNHTAINAGGTGHTGGDSPVIADLTTGTSVTVTVRVWIEGTDPEATNDAIGGIFSIKLNLYAMVL